MQVVLTSHKKCPKCGVEATVEVDGFFGALLMANALAELEKVGGTIKGNCGHSFYVEPVPKKPTLRKRLKKSFKEIFKC